VRFRPAALLLLGLLLAGAAAPVSREAREQAYRANNHGVGLIEQYRFADAVTSLRQALTFDPELGIAKVNLAIALLNVPDLPGAARAAQRALAQQPGSLRAHYVLGLVARAENRAQDAQAAFREVLAADPSDVGSNVNLGQIMMQEQDYAGALAAFRAAVAAAPHNATALYNLGLALTRSGQAQEGKQTLERFRTLRASGAATLIGKTYPEQGRYAEAIVSTGAEPSLVDRATPPVRFADASAETLPSGALRHAARVTLFDLDGDSDLDAFVIGADGQRLYRNDGGRFVDVTRELGLDPAQGGVGAVAGDVDNDTRPDLVVLRAGGVTLLRNGPKGFEDVTAAAGLQDAGAAASAALADFDHDGDLDLILGGAERPNRLYQNAGNATFKDVAASAGVGQPGEVIAVVPTDYDNGRDMDLLEAVAGQATRLYSNRRDGTFDDVAERVGLARGTRVRCVAAGDVNKDGYTDFFLGSDDGDLLALSDGKRGFSVAPAPWGSKGTTAAQFLDYDDDGLLDLVSFSPEGARVLRNLGDRFVDVSEAALGESRRLTVAAFAAADLDGDGDTDLVLVLADGGLRVLRNDGGSRNGAVRVRLSGLVSNRSGVGAKVELRAGSLQQKLETSAATPPAGPADVEFGLGGRGPADAVRVIWPSGIVQTELGPGAGGAAKVALFDVKELDRKPSSCPYLYAWNGRDFGFVTDFMGGGEMGYLEEPGVYNRPDPVEYVRLRDGQLRPRQGRYELRVTNELEEALFVDRLALLAVTHPQDVEVYPYEGMTDPPKPERLIAVRGARPPLGAIDDRGHDVLERVARLDRKAPDDFRLLPVRGYAEPHTLTLELGPVAQRAVLLLTGWTDYAWSSDNVAAHQAGLSMRAPSLQVQDAAGRWVTAVEQVGIPVGRPQTVVVDLSGVFRGPSRRVRILTNMQIYWDQIEVGTIADVPLRPVALPLVSAALSERGFSAETSPDGRSPYGYDYARVSQASPWKAIPGLYTRAGDVRELLAASDDVFVTSRPGDAIALSFDARALAPPPPGSALSFLVYSDGFSKEMDINSATPDSLGPLPFHGMSRYPYAAPEAYPLTPERARLIALYDTRLVKAPVASLELDAEQASH
jgi:tetratricopeptide (TPR) repeat protein